MRGRVERRGLLKVRLPAWLQERGLPIALSVQLPYGLARHALQQA